MAKESKTSELQEETGQKGATMKSEEQLMWELKEAREEVAWATGSVNEAEGEVLAATNKCNKFKQWLQTATGKMCDAKSALDKFRDGKNGKETK